MNTYYQKPPNTQSVVLNDWNENDELILEYYAIIPETNNHLEPEINFLNYIPVQETELADYYSGC